MWTYQGVLKAQLFQGQDAQRRSGAIGFGLPGRCPTSYPCCERAGFAVALLRNNKTHIK